MTPLLDNTSRSKLKIRKGSRLILILITGTLIVITLLFTIIRISPEFNQYDLVRNYPLDTNSLKTPSTILLWSSFFGDKRWSLPDDTLGPTFFRDDLHCPVYHCEITNEHNFLPAIELFDAIIFHTAEPFPLTSSIPRERKTNQLYVFALMEPPGETKHILNDEINFYNLTMTYRLDSDIVWPYRTVYDIERNEHIAPAKYPNWRQVPDLWNDTEIFDIWSGKKKFAAWFVSHCDTLSKREKLANELQKHVDVDIYGKCGTMSCKHLSKECDDLLDNEYKFYFSFENALCTDYVTEKLYNMLERNIIPVVFGGGNYDRFIPPHSYINVENFETIESLVDHLKYVASNSTEYMRYFWWRPYYKLSYKSPFCDLCEKLHQTEYTEKLQSYNNIEKWWVGGSRCRFESFIKF